MDNLHCYQKSSIFDAKRVPNGVSQNMGLFLHLEHQTQQIDCGILLCLWIESTSVWIDCVNNAVGARLSQFHTWVGIEHASYVTDAKFLVRGQFMLASDS